MKTLDAARWPRSIAPNHHGLGGGPPASFSSRGWRLVVPDFGKHSFRWCSARIWIRPLAKGIP
jgi:hypothetical protein